MCFHQIQLKQVLIQFKEEETQRWCRAAAVAFGGASVQQALIRGKGKSIGIVALPQFKHHDISSNRVTKGLCSTSVRFCSLSAANLVIDSDFWLQAIT